MLRLGRKHEKRKRKNTGQCERKSEKMGDERVKCIQSGDTSGEKEEIEAKKIPAELTNRIICKKSHVVKDIISERVEEI